MKTAKLFRVLCACATAWLSAAGDASADGLPADRILLFNAWSDGNDYGSYGNWTHLDDFEPQPTSQNAVVKRNYAALLSGTNHTYMGWTVNMGRIGSSSYISGAKPVSPKEYTIDGNTVTNAQLSLMNIALASEDAAGANIVSPYYTNGVGTVYFDASGVFAAGTLAIDIATNMVSTTGSGATSAMRENEVTGWRFNWTKVADVSVISSSGSWTKHQQTLDYPGSIRIRIRRTSYVSSARTLDASLIAVDNIQVSYPRVGVSVSAGSIEKTPGRKASANVTCIVSNEDFSESLLPEQYSDWNSREVKVYYREGTSGSWSSAAMEFDPDSGDGFGNNEKYSATFTFPEGTETIQYYYSVQVTGNRYFPQDYTLTGQTYWTDGGEPILSATSSTATKDVAEWSTDKKDSKLAVSRLMLFNTWNGVDYGSYDGGQWSHGDDYPPQPSSQNAVVRRTYNALLPGTNHVHEAGWEVHRGRTGSSAFISSANYVPPQMLGTGITNCTANLQGVEGAELVSPFYPDGIGTIYFDTVNLSRSAEETFSLQIATNMYNATKGIVADVPMVADEYSEPDEFDPSITNRYVLNWVECDATNVFFSASPVNGTNDFMRYQKTLNWQDAIRFRIRRTSMPATARTEDVQVFPIDNIQVSKPPADVKVEFEDFAFTPGYPSAGQRLAIRCRVSNVSTNAPTTYEYRNVEVHYRWRYLDQQVDPWQVRTMTYQKGADGDDGNGNGELYSADIPAYDQVGDIEYYFVCDFDGYRYAPVDYAGQGHKYWANSTENSENLSPRTLSNGTYEDGSVKGYSIRLRPYKSDIGAMMIKTDFLDEPLEMELVADDVWRGMVPLVDIENDEEDPGRFTCYLFATNTYVVTESETGQLVPSLDHTPRYWAELGQTSVSPAPTGGLCQETDQEPEGMQFRVRGSGYAQIELNLKTLEYKVARAEYQNFDEWAAYTNNFATTYGQRTKQVYKENFSDWTLSQDSSKGDTFAIALSSLAVTNQYRASLTDIFRTFYGYNATYAAELYQANETNNPAGTAWNSSGRQNPNIAMRLLGSDGYYSSDNVNSLFQNGYLTTKGGSLTDGLKTFSFKARAYSHPSPEQMVQYIGSDLPKWSDIHPQNYVFSSAVRFLEISPEQFSVSVIGYVQNQSTFYEARLTQYRPANVNLSVSSATYARLEIYRWKDGVPTLLTQSAALNSGNLSFTANTTTGNLYICLNTSDARTKIRAQWGETYYVEYEDRDILNRLTSGMAGFMSANCRVQFYSARTRSYTGEGNATSGANPKDLNMSSDRVSYNWSWDPARFLYGDGVFTTQQPTTQLAVYLQEGEYRGENVSSPDASENGWGDIVTNFTVSSFQYQTFSYSPQVAQAQHVKIQNTGRYDIAVDELSMLSWHGESEIGEDDTEWHATEAWVSQGTGVDASRGKFVELDMTRADQNDGGEWKGDRQYIMTPSMENGLGQISFWYRVAKAPVQMTVQYNSNGQWVDAIDGSFTVDAAQNSWSQFVCYIGKTNELDNGSEAYIRVLNDGRNGVTNGVVYVDDFIAWDEPAVSNTSWKVYNGLVSDKDKSKVSLNGSQVLILNNTTTNAPLELTPMDAFPPHLKSPLLVNGAGEIRFEARLANTNQTGGTIYIFGMTNDDWYAEDNWVEITQLTVTNVAKQFYSVHVRDSQTYPVLHENTFYGIKLQTTKSGELPQVCIENVAISEPVEPGFDINDVKLLYHKNNDEYAYREPMQPLTSDRIGVEARLTNLRLSPRNIKVYLSYYIGTNTWGISKLWGTPGIETWNSLQRTTIQMEQVDPENDPLLYRTPFNDDIPFQEENTVVQYCVWARYENTPNEGEQPTQYLQWQKEDAFTTPSWYYPLDFNKAYGGWSPYFIVYRIPYGVAFINELNPIEYDYASELVGAAFNPYVELAIPANIDMSGWSVEFVQGSGATVQGPELYTDISGMDEVTNGYAFVLLANRDQYTTPGLSNIDLYIPGSIYQAFDISQGAVRLKRPLGMYEQSVWYTCSPTEQPNEVFDSFKSLGDNVYFAGHDIENGSLCVTNGWGAKREDWAFLTSITNNVEGEVVYFDQHVWTPRAPNYVQELPAIPEIYNAISNVTLTAKIIDTSGTTLQNGTRNDLVFKIQKEEGCTNIVYDTANWRRVSRVTANGRDCTSWLAQTDGVLTNYVLSVTNLVEDTVIRAYVDIDPSLSAQQGVPELVAEWMQSYPDNLVVDSYYVPTGRKLTFTELYWLNCEPTNVNYFDGGFTGKVERLDAASNIYLTVWATINGKNLTTLRGKEQSVRPAFKIKVNNDLTNSYTWRTVKQYYLTENSFDENHSCRLLLDGKPLIVPGVEWHLYDEPWASRAFFKWVIEFDENYEMRFEMTNCPAISE